MLTVLNIKNEKTTNINQKIHALLRPYKIETELRQCENIEVHYINYISRRGEIKFDKIYDCCIGKRKTVLCDSDISLDKSKLKRFTGIHFKKIMLENFVCSILDKSDIPPSDIRISYYDPLADNPAFAERLLGYSTRLTVVSDMPRFYENEAERIADKCGASVMVSNDLSALCPCDLLIAPIIIDKAIPTTHNDIIFTLSSPLAAVSGNIITEYYTEFPEKYSPLLPEGFDEMYFLSGLYSLCSVYELDRLIPHSCGSVNQKYTAENIIRLIQTKCRR